jgi:high-affinity nickel-transport protein
MTQDLISFSGLALMFLLGLRHGLDPDHIACIDGLTWRALNQQHGHAHWIGTLFAVGHGLLVTAIAVGVSRFALSIDVAPVVVQVFGCVPTALLVVVGTINLRLLLARSEAFEPTGWKMRFVPPRLRSHTSPWAVVAIGVLFATVFDTATQAAAWGYVASNSGGGMLAALGAGLIFTAGMVITDTLDGRLVCRISRSRNGIVAGRRLRRSLGWLIVAISYGVAGYNIARAWAPEIELDETMFSLAGLSLVTLMFAIWAWTARSRLRKAVAANAGD